MTRKVTLNNSKMRRVLASRATRERKERKIDPYTSLQGPMKARMRAARKRWGRCPASAEGDEGAAPWRCLPVVRRAPLAMRTRAGQRTLPGRPGGGAGGSEARDAFRAAEAV